MTEFQQSVINLVNSGLTHSEIVKKLNCPKSSVSSVIKRFNLNINKKYTNTIKDDYFDTIDSDQKAYLLGFFIADGCIFKDTKRSIGRMCISQSIDDIEVVNAYKQQLNVPSDIVYINYNFGAKHRKTQIRLRWTSKHMKNTLLSYNIKPNKTKDFEFKFPLEKIPKEYYGSFVRGFIDGDGCFESCKHIFTPSVVSTSKYFITQIGDLVSKYTDLSYKIYECKGKTCNWFHLRWNADRNNKYDKITKLYNFLYNNASIYLTRKKEKIEAYLEYRANQLNNIN